MATTPETVEYTNPHFFNVQNRFLAALAVSATMLGPTVEAAPAKPESNSVAVHATSNVPRFLGAAVSARFLDEPGYSETFNRYYDSLTPENELKMAYTEPRPNTFTFHDADTLVDMAVADGKRIHGHALIYPAQDPLWIKQRAATCSDGIFDEAERTDLINHMYDHIETVVNRYKDRIHEWDVVNEAVDDNNTWQKCIGPEYIPMAFAAAHQADPTADLYISEFNAETPFVNGISNPRFAKFQNIVNNLLASHAPITGVGLQTHVTTKFVDQLDDLSSTMDIFRSEGLKIELTEADVFMPINQNGSDNEKAQTATYAGLAKVCSSNPNCVGITSWSVNDATSWLAPGLPSLITKDNIPKPAMALVRKSLAPQKSRKHRPAKKNR